MNWKKGVAAMPLLFGFISPPAAAETFQFSSEFSGSGGTCANTVCATLEVTQDGSDVDFVLTADLEGVEKITGIYGNQDPFNFGAGAGDSQIVDLDPAALVNAVSTGEDAFKADGDGFFDWNIDLFTNTGLEDNDTLTWTITNTDLADIIDALSQGGDDPNKTGFTFALRVQGLATGSGSGWFFSVLREPPEEVSEPGILALFGLGVFLLGFEQRRRSAIG